MRLNQRERKRRVNILLLTLRSYKSEFVNIIKVIKLKIIKLNKEILIKINEIEYIIYIYIIVFIKDIK